VNDPSARSSNEAACCGGLTSDTDKAVRLGSKSPASTPGLATARVAPAASQNESSAATGARLAAATGETSVPPERAAANEVNNSSTHHKSLRKSRDVSSSVSALARASATLSILARLTST